MLQSERPGTKARLIGEKSLLRLIRWCHRRRWPLLSRAVLRAYRHAAQFQLSPAEIVLVLAQLYRANTFLVFGIGRDTPLWAALGPGQTHFIEDDEEWIKSYPELEGRIHTVRYTTVVDQFRDLLQQPEALELDLPKAVSGREWDVILVDAPHGFEAGMPGRMQSIHAASRLIRPGGVVLVHDMDREVEQVYAATFLGQSLRRAGRTALFRATWNTRPPFTPGAVEAVSAARPGEEVPPDRIVPYYRDEQVEINIVNFAEPMSPRPRHEREVLLVRDPWYPGAPRLSSLRHRLRSASYFEQVYYLSNTPQMDRWRRLAGFNSHFINMGCFVDENTFQPPHAEVDRIYDAVMIGRFSWHENDQLKRHCLTTEVERLALLDPIHASESSYYREHYQRRPNCVCFNTRRLPAGEVAGILRQSHCGLILSAHEGACRASSEYLLSGLPVISTPSVGGRDVWYDDYNAVIVEPDPAAVQAAVLKLKQSPRDPWRIRRRYLQQANTFRQRFVHDVLTRVFQRFDVARDPIEVFHSHPFRWWPDE